MTTFHAPHNHRTLTIGQHADGSGITFHTEDGSARAGVYLDPADDAAIALAVMEAAQQEKQDSDPASADYARHQAMNWLMTARDRAAKEAAAAAEEAARGKRRDELARELTREAYGPDATVGNYKQAADAVRVAIDRIIDTELELAKERAK